MSEMLLTISELLGLQSLNAKWNGSASVSSKPLAGISTDSRKIGPGELFWAIKGDRFDGHAFVLQAIEDGAVAAVVSREWFEAKKSALHGKPLILVDDTLEAYQLLARHYRLKFNIPVIAITGSSGKTTTKEFVASVLSQKVHVLKNIKSFNNHIGVPATLFQLRTEHQILVAEVGTNHFGELDRLSYLVQPSVCVITNIGYAHLEFFASLEGVTRAKMEVLNHLTGDGVVFYNGDDKILAGQTFSGRKSVSFGVNSLSDIRATALECDGLGRYEFVLDNTKIKLAIPGRHNVSNALAAAAIGRHFSLTTEDIKNGIESVQSVDKRMQVQRLGDVFILNDSYNGNPGSCRAALETAADIKVENGGRRIAVFGDMLELGAYSQEEHVKLADEIRKADFKAIFLFGDETKFTATRAKELAFQKVAHYKEMDLLIHDLKEYVKPHDFLLIKGSRSMRMERVIDGLQDSL
ncbi:MAG: UDP-N-acetylmuramoyl-tripeptide--D-alanyl-D-alanine ligase [Actinobacteria bacterium]|nr:UDP-N-acetylmuramoyl-tripeptide--D-alanyl-D-alanine ligase [Actinomycetota bacterium]